MKVVVDATMLDGRPSGAATRLAGLARALAERGTVELLHLVRPGLDPLPGHPRRELDGLTTPWARGRAGRRLDRLLTDERADLYQAGALPLARITAAPQVLTVHDLRSADPAGPEPWPRRAWTRWRLGPNLRRAARVVAVSETTRAALVSGGFCPAARVAVVPNGPTPDLALVADLDRVAAFRRRAELNRRYVLALGPVSAHKRLGELLETLAAVSALPGGDDLGLVLAGRADPEGALVVSRRARRLGLAERVRLTDVLDDQALAAALTGAEALVFAGRHEGFSIPALDGLALGLPVVAPEAGAFPEVLADAGWRYPPGDAAAAARCWLAAVTPGPEREARLAAGRRRAADFSWAASAEALEQVWREALA